MTIGTKELVGNITFKIPRSLEKFIMKMVVKENSFPYAS